MLIKGETIALLCILLLLLTIAVVAYGATVVGSKHDIGTGGEEVCVYCHTPHFLIQVQGDLFWESLTQEAHYVSHVT